MATDAKFNLLTSFEFLVDPKRILLTKDFLFLIEEIRYQNLSEELLKEIMPTFKTLHADTFMQKYLCMNTKRIELLPSILRNRFEGVQIMIDLVNDQASAAYQLCKDPSPNLIILKEKLIEVARCFYLVLMGLRDLGIQIGYEPEYEELLRFKQRYERSIPIALLAFLQPYSIVL